MPQANVVITGLGVVSSIGIGCEPFFASLMAGRSGVRSLAERTDGGAKPGHIEHPPGLWVGAPITDFDPKQYVRPRKALKVMCREIQLAFAASQLAVEDAGLSDDLPASEEGMLVPADIGTVFGSEMFYGPPVEMEDAIKHCMGPDGIVDGSKFGGFAMRDIMPLWMLKYLPNMPACHVGIALNAHGPNNTLVVGDISGPAAMIEAASCLRRGIAKVVVNGAAGTRVNTTRMNYRADLPLPSVADPVANSSRPHDPNSTGVVGGEGAVTLVLESAESGEARQASTWAKVCSYASRFVASAGMSHVKRPCGNDVAEARASAEAIRLASEAAVADAGLSAGDIGLVVSHAMGDPLVDLAERQVLESTFFDAPVVAPMASIGYTGAASGQFGLLVGAMALAHRAVPPTLNAEAAAVSLQREAQPLTKGHVLCLSHTTEGNATAVVMATGSRDLSGVS